MEKDLKGMFMTTNMSKAGLRTQNKGQPGVKTKTNEGLVYHKRAANQ